MLKIWLKRYRYVLIFAICLIAAGTVAETYFFAPSEPEVCALCGEGKPYHAPVLMNLSTGKKSELRVYQNDMSHPGELDDNQRDGYMQLLFFDGFSGVQSGGRGCMVTLPEQKKRMRQALYCEDCWALLAEVRGDSFALIDLHDPENMIIYPVMEGAEYTIRDYTAEIITEEQDGLHIVVTGHVPFDFSQYSAEPPEI